MSDACTTNSVGFCYKNISVYLTEISEFIAALAALNRDSLQSHTFVSSSSVLLLSISISFVNIFASAINIYQ